MKLFEIYHNRNIANEFWKTLEEDSLLTEDNSPRLIDLIAKANDVIFRKFGISPNERKYFIAGSGRLHFYPDILNFLGIQAPIGDLDIVIPNKIDWINAGLEAEYNEGGIYRPTKDNSIEAFNEWVPAKAGGPYADISVRDTNTILNDATSISGYFFMSMADIVDYKIKMGREKEEGIVKLMERYIGGSDKDKRSMLKKIANQIGVNNTRNLFK